MDSTSENQSISQKLEGIKQDDEAAITAMWDRYYPALSKFADKRLEAIGVQQRAFNGEDVNTVPKAIVRSLSPLSIDELKDDIGACCHTAGFRSSDKGFLPMSVAFSVLA